MCVSYLWKALFVHMVHHDYLVVIAGGGTSRAGEEKQKNMEYSRKDLAFPHRINPVTFCVQTDGEHVQSVLEVRLALDGNV